MIKLHWLPIKARIEFKICLIVLKALRFGQPKYIADMLSPPVTISHLTLCSDDDPYRLHETRAVGERAFAERSFVGISDTNLYRFVLFSFPFLISVE